MTEVIGSDFRLIVDNREEYYQYNSDRHRPSTNALCYYHKHKINHSESKKGGEGGVWLRGAWAFNECTTGVRKGLGMCRQV